MPDAITLNVHPTELVTAIPGSPNALAGIAVQAESADSWWIQVALVDDLSDRHLAMIERAVAAALQRLVEQGPGPGSGWAVVEHADGTNWECRLGLVDIGEQSEN